MHVFCCVADFYVWKLCKAPEDFGMGKLDSGKEGGSFYLQTARSLFVVL